MGRADRWRRAVAWPIAAITALSLSGIAGAPPVRVALADGTADEADAHFRMGMAEYQKGAFDSALTHFLASNRLAPNRNVLFNIGGTYEAMGRSADAYRYYDEALAGEVDPQLRATVEAALARTATKVAVLHVTTDPAGATIYVDRKDLGSLGKSPRALALAPGKHRILAELDGYEARTSEEVDLVLGKDVKVALSLTRIVGGLRVTIDGGGAADVIVDEGPARTSCAGTCALTLSPGKHEIAIRAEGHEPATRSIVVEAGKTSELPVKLTPLTGSLLVQAEERDAAVFVDGKPVGFTPLVAPSIPAGKRVVRVELRGFEPVTRAVEIEPNKQSALRDVLLSPLRQVSAASRALENVDDAPSSVTILDRREIEAFGYPTIYSAMHGVRGFVTSHDRAYASISARSTGQPQDYSSRILLLWDGHAMNEGAGSTASTDYAAMQDLHDVERIEVVRGPGSLLYGTGAFGGVINLVTRPADDSTSIHAGLGAYNDNVLHGRAGFRHDFGGGRSIWASVSAAYSPGSDVSVPDDKDPSLRRVARKVEGLSAQGAAGRAAWGPLSAEWLFQTREVLGSLGVYGTVFDDARSHFRDTRFMTEVRYEPRLSERWTLLARLAVDHSRYESHVFYDDGSHLHEDEPVTWITGEARAVYSPISSFKLVGGASVQAFPAVHLGGASVEGDEELPYLNEDHPFVIGSAYALVEGSPARWIRFSAGLRGDLYSTFGPIGVPRAAVILKPADGHVLKIMGGRAFRAPSVFEQFYNDGGLFFARSVDPARGLTLGPESIVSGEIEYSTRFLRDFVATAAIHASEIDGIILTTPDAPGSQAIRQVNSDEPAVIAGGELELRREWRGGLMASATYGYQQARLVGSTSPDSWVPNVPEHTAAAKLVAPVIEDLVSVGLRAVLEAPRKIASDDARRTPTAVIADLTLSGLIRKVGIRYTLGVYNAMDWRHVLPSPGYPTGTVPQLGRTFLFDLLWTRDL